MAHLRDDCPSLVDFCLFSNNSSPTGHQSVGSSQLEIVFVSVNNNWNISALLLRYKPSQLITKIYKMAYQRFLFVLIVWLLAICSQIETILTKECSQREFVYGENDIVDELLTCSLSKSFDLDLTPYSDHSKSTSKTLVEQGLSNRTSILHARLSGIWTAKRPSFVQTGWRCDGNKTTSTSIIELSSLSLEVIEKMEAPMARNQHKLAAHKPCKTFDLPTYMCRQTKPIYRTVSTWVNRAYYNITLVQNSGEARPAIARLSTMFTCPETFKQRITYSPSSTYLLMRPSLSSTANHHHYGQTRKQTKREFQVKKLTPGGKTQSVNDIPSFGPAGSFTTSQSSNMPASPLYHNSVKVIINEVTQVLRTALEDCIDSLEANLSLVNDYRSFKEQKYDLGVDPNQEDEAFRENVHSGITNECSNKLWIKSRIELANQVNSLEEEEAPAAKVKPSPAKRNQIGVGQHDEPGELLNPYGFYHDPSAELMID